MTKDIHFGGSTRMLDTNDRNNNPFESQGDGETIKVFSQNQPYAGPENMATRNGNVANTVANTVVRQQPKGSMMLPPTSHAKKHSSGA